MQQAREPAPRRQLGVGWRRPAPLKARQLLQPLQGGRECGQLARVAPRQALQLRQAAEQRRQLALQRAAAGAKLVAAAGVHAQRGERGEGLERHGGGEEVAVAELQLLQAWAQGGQQAEAGGGAAAAGDGQAPQAGQRGQLRGRKGGATGEGRVLCCLLDAPI